MQIRRAVAGRRRHHAENAALCGREINDLLGHQAMAISAKASAPSSVMSTFFAFARTAVRCPPGSAPVPKAFAVLPARCDIHPGGIEGGVRKQTHTAEFEQRRRAADVSQSERLLSHLPSWIHSDKCGDSLPHARANPELTQG
jgi:hypothetical protein